MTPHLTLADVRDELRRGPVIERQILNETHHVDGYCDYSRGEIVINPFPVEFADTILHELCHRLYPDWTEARVKRETKRLRRTMDESDIRRLILAYRRRRKQRATPVELVTP